MLTIILAIFMCYASYAQEDFNGSKVNLTVVYYNWYHKPYTFSFLFYKQILTRFKDCLCSESSVGCNIVFDAFSVKHYEVKGLVNETMTSRPLLHPINYLCEFDTFDTRNALCRREEKGSNAFRTFYYINESYCELTCVKISWNDTQNVTLSKNEICVPSKAGLSPACRAPTSNTVNTTSPQSTTFSKITKSTTNKLDSENRDTDKKVPIIIGVVIAVIVLGVIATGIVFYRRTKLKHLKSNNDGKENSKSDGDSVSNNIKPLRNNIRSNLQLTKAKTENMSEKTQENESCYQNQDYSSIGNVNVQNLPGDKNAHDEKTNLNKTKPEKKVNTIFDHSIGIYNNSVENPKIVGSEMVSPTTEQIPQINGDVNGVEKSNLSQSQDLLDNAYSNFQKPPITAKELDHKQIIPEASFPLNYELATSINLPVSDNTGGKPEAFALKPSAAEYSRLGDKSRDFKNPYNTLPDTDTPMSHFKGPAEIEEPISNMSSEVPLTHIISCQNDYSFADYNGNSGTDIAPSEYHIAT